MKIVFVNPVGAIGGAERALLNLFAALKSLQPAIQLYLIAGTDGPFLASAQALGVNVQVLPLPKQLNQLGDSALKNNRRLGARLQLSLKIASILPAVWQYLANFRQTIRDIQPDIIHSNGIKAHLLTALASVQKVPIVWHIQDFYSTRPLVRQLLRWLSNRATVGLAISKAVAEDAKLTLPKLSIATIYSAIDTNCFSPRSSDSLNHKHAAPVRIGLIAAFARWKGHLVFLDAAAEVIRDRASNPAQPDVRFYIIGGPIYQTQGSQFSEQELRERVAALQIADWVEFTGFQKDVVNSYHALDVVVHASTQPEPLGLVIIEAMACRKPVIVANAGGAAELFTHNHDAIGVPPGDPITLAAAMNQLINHPQQRQQLASNARATALKHFNLERLGQQTLTLYNTLLTASRSSRDL